MRREERLMATRDDEESIESVIPDFEEGRLPGE